MGGLMSLESIVNVFKNKISKRKYSSLCDLLEIELDKNIDNQYTLFDAARQYFANNGDSDSSERMNNFLDSLTTGGFEEGVAGVRRWHSFSIGMILMHNQALALTKCVNYEKIESLLYKKIKPSIKIHFCDIIFPTESLRKYTITDVLRLSQDLKGISKGEENGLAAAQLHAKNILLKDIPQDPDLSEGLLFFNAFCTEKEAKSILDFLQEICLEDESSNMILYAQDQTGRVHKVKVMVFDAGPLWSVSQDSVHAVEVFNTISFIKKSISAVPIDPQDVEISVALYKNSFGSLNVKLAISCGNEFIAGTDIDNVMFPELFVEKLDEMLYANGLNIVNRAVFLRKNNEPLQNEYFVESSWVIID